MPNLSTKITALNKIGVTTAGRLKLLGVITVQDLLNHFPFRYEDYSAVTKIENLRPGQTANVVAQVELMENRRAHRRRMFVTEALVADDTSSLKVVWFNQPFLAKTLHTGDLVSLSGKVENDFGGLVMKSPNYEKIQHGAAVHTQGLVPIYPLTANLTQKQVRFLVSQVIDNVDQIEDWLPEDIQKRNHLLPLGEAIRKIHFPKTMVEQDEAHRRISFNELFLIQLQSQYVKQNLKNSVADPIAFAEQATKDFVKSLPFTLTDAQKKAAWEILQDMQKDKPMTRLLEGDVGSGKTVVASIAILNCALNKKQSVLLVPTEILACQHFNGICRLFQNTEIRVALFTRSEQKMCTSGEMEDISGKIKAKSKDNMVEMIKNGGVDVVIGTHALIQENISFHNLGLAIIDEQHRFGVEQRKKLIEKAGDNHAVPHLLSMTATPIPRSLALVLFGDLDISIINQMPKGRKVIFTKAVPERQRKEAYAFIRQQIEQGRQAFVICPLIDISDRLGVKSVKEEFEKLDKNIFPDIPMAMLHGKLKSEDKEMIMADFLKNKTKILVSTSVIEVGVDVPNATIMMIEGADRFGLAQLHQFRGRVGRSEHQSYCFLFSDNNGENVRARLSALEKYHDGFTLAKIDLRHRGPGEVYGTSQKGFPKFKVASLFDHELIKLTNEEAVKLITEDPKLEKLPIIKEKLAEWESDLHLE